MSRDESRVRNILIILEEVFFKQFFLMYHNSNSIFNSTKVNNIVQLFNKKKMGKGNMSPRANNTAIEKLNWTRKEDNRVRELQSKNSLSQSEDLELKQLQSRNDEFLKLGEENFHEVSVIIVEVISAAPGRPDKNSKGFAEVKLRVVEDGGKIVKTHDNPQKFTTKTTPISSTVESESAFVWNEKVKLACPMNDAIRISIFYSRLAAVKRKCFSVDVLPRQLNLEPGVSIHKVIPATRGSGNLEVVFRRL